MKKIVIILAFIAIGCSDNCQTLSDNSLEGYTYLRTIESSCGLEGYDGKYLYKINMTSNR